MERGPILLVEIILLGWGDGGEVQKGAAYLFGRRFPHYKRGSFGD